MELKQLEYFIAVAEESNFTRAAERVHISQSGVSAQIRKLELDLGADLFDRSGRAVSLTAAGNIALERARLVLDSVEALRQAVNEVTGLIQGRLTVGMITGCTVQGLFDTLAAFHVAHPGIDISLVEDNSGPLAERVRAGELDLALVGTSGEPPTGLGAMAISSERLVAAVPFEHPLAAKDHTLLRDVSGYAIVCMPDGTAPRALFNQACEATGIVPNIVLQASAPDAVADLAARGLGVAILTESMAVLHEGRLKALVIDDIVSTVGLALIWKASRSPALQELIRRSREAFADPLPRQVIPSGGRAVR
ncbi:MAG: LysR family transcriptional regulator [Actinomycetota bacterium]|nr:LysR family transcriptional regulator [Actinomycetota bacterium]